MRNHAETIWLLQGRLSLSIWELCMLLKGLIRTGKQQMILKELKLENKKKWLKVSNLEKCPKNKRFSQHFTLEDSYKQKMLFLMTMESPTCQVERKKHLFFQKKSKTIQKLLLFKKHAMEVFSQSQSDKNLINMTMLCQNT